jgi:hypothetical protein
MALFQTPVGKDQLQRWNIHPFRRQLPERLRGMAVLVAWSSEVEATDSHDVVFEELTVFLTAS